MGERILCTVSSCTNVLALVSDGNMFSEVKCSEVKYLGIFRDFSPQAHSTAAECSNMLTDRQTDSEGQWSTVEWSEVNYMPHTRMTIFCNGFKAQLPHHYRMADIEAGGVTGRCYTAS